MCMLLKLHFAKFGVSNFFQKLLKKSFWELTPTPHIGLGKVNPKQAGGRICPFGFS